jgi:hypothetical protein
VQNALVGGGELLRSALNAKDGLRNIQNDNVIVDEQLLDCDFQRQGMWCGIKHNSNHTLHRIVCTSATSV